MHFFEIIPTLQTGGAEKFVVDFSNELVANNHKCTLVTFGKEDFLSKLLDQRILRLRIDCRSICPKIEVMIRLLRSIIKDKPDVVHVHITAIPYILLACLFYKKCKYVATIHSEAKREAGKGFAKYVRRVLFKCRLCQAITISKESQNSFRNFYGFEAPLIINGAIDYCGLTNTESFLLKKNAKIKLLHVARIECVKNQLLLVKVVSRLIDEGFDIFLCMIGRVDKRDLFEELQCYFSDRIVHLGELLNPRDYMKNADAFCLSSLMEGMPITIIEAFSVGCPVIATPAGGCVNMIDGLNGLLAKDFSEESYYEVLRKFCSMTEVERHRMSLHARQSYEECYSMSKTMKGYIALIKRL